MSVTQSGTKATESYEGPVDLDEEVFCDEETEITSQTNHLQKEGHQQQRGQLSHVRIVDVTPPMFYLNQRAANVEAQRLYHDKLSQQQAQPHLRHKQASSSRNSRRRSATFCLPRWILSAPTWVKFVGLCCFVLVVSSVVFLAVYHLIQWDAKHRDATNGAGPEYHTTPQYPPPHQQHYPTPVPISVTSTTASPEQHQSLYRNSDESLSNATLAKTEGFLAATTTSTPTAFPTFAPAPPPFPNQG